MMEQSKSEVHIPNKRYFTIGEVSSICGLKTHVLRYWEQEFSELEPIKRKGNRRYYQQKDLILVCLLYTSPSPRDRTRSRMPSSA